MNNEYILAKYLRISADDGQAGESQSIEGQRVLLDDFILNHPELQKAKLLEYTDDGHSGTSFNRPGIKALLEHAKNGKVNAIIVKDFSRFGRNYIDVGDYLEQVFPFLHVRFISVNDKFDSERQGSPAGDVSVAFKSLCNDYYSKDLSRKIRAGVYTLRETGKYLSPFAVYGYRKSLTDPYQLEIDESTAAVVQRIFKMRLDGTLCRVIAKALNDDGIPTPMMYKRQNGIKKGWNSLTAENAWNDGTIRSILKDIRYIGAVTQGMYKCDVVGSNRHRRLPAEQWHISYGKHEPIVSEEMFKAVQLSFEHHKSKSTNKVNDNDKSLLSGKVRCGGCGYSLLQRHTRVPKYYCKQREFTGSETCVSEQVEIPVVETVLINAIQKLFDISADEAWKHKEFTNKQTVALRELLKKMQAIQRQITDFQNDKMALYTRYCESEITKTEYINLRDEADNNLALLSKQADALELRRIELSDNLTERRNETINNLRFDGQLTREIVDTLVDKVIIYSSDKIDVKWKFSDPAIINA